MGLTTRTSFLKSDSLSKINFLKSDNSVINKVNFIKTNREEDPYFNNISLLLHMNGNNNSQIFTDSSLNSLQVDVYGGAKISTNIKKIGSGSGYFERNTFSFLTINSPTAFNFGTGDFTIEMWFLNLEASASGAPRFQFEFFNPTLGGRYLYMAVFDDILQVRHNGNAQNIIVVGQYGNSLEYNEWNHIAISKQNQVLKIFLNGIEIESIYENFNYNPTKIIIGCGADGVNNPNSTFTKMNGYLDEFCVTKGIARYTSNFTPPNYERYKYVPPIAI